jgi:hypothetical protein
VWGVSVYDYGRSLQYPGPGDYLMLGSWAIHHSPELYSIRQVHPGQAIKYRFDGNNPYIPIPREKREWLEEVVS